MQPASRAKIAALPREITPVTEPPDKTPTTTRRGGQGRVAFGGVNLRRQADPAHFRSTSPINPHFECPYAPARSSAE